LNPYLKSGLLRPYVEKGEVLEINDCHPRTGIVDS
jgi:hypothetical protein